MWIKSKLKVIGKQWNEQVETIEKKLAKWKTLKIIHRGILKLNRIDFDKTITSFCKGVACCDWG